MTKKTTMNKSHFIKCPDETWWAFKRIAAERKEKLGDAFIEVINAYDQRKRRLKPNKQT